MSVEYSCYIVDWAEVQAKFQEVEAIQYFAPDEEEDETEETVPDYPESDLEATPREGRAFLENYSYFSDDWTSPSKPAAEQLFRTIFWSVTSDKYRIMELNAPKENLTWVEFAFAPPTVERLAQLAAAIDLTTLRDVYRYRPSTSDYFKNADEFVTFAKQWIDLVLKAKESNAGLICMVFC